jgi:hypothetical protein
MRAEATLDQQTMEICLREIERCQQTGIKPNFIVLLPIVANSSMPAGWPAGTRWVGCIDWNWWSDASTGLSLPPGIECIRIEAIRLSTRAGERARSSLEETRTDSLTDLAPIPYRIASASPPCPPFRLGGMKAGVA